MKNDAYVLVVDDNPSRRNWVHQALAALPYSIVAVPSTYQALRSLKKVPAKAVIVGEGLRQRDLQRFQAVMRKRSPAIPVLVASCPWPVGTDLTEMSPGGYHCLVLCTQNESARLREMLRKALETQQEEKTCLHGVRTSNQRERKIRGLSHQLI